MYERIRKSIPGSRSKGSRYIRMMLGHFTVGSTLFSKHTILIYQPTQKSLSEVLHQYSPNGFPEKIVKRIIRQILEALDFCHVHAKIVHNGRFFVFLPPPSPPEQGSSPCDIY